MRNTIYQEKIIHEKLNDLSNYLGQVENLNIKLDFCDYDELEYVHKEINEVYYRFNSTIKELYLILINYFESQNSRELLELIKLDLKHLRNNDPNYNSISSLYYEEYEQAYYISEDLNLIRKFLLPFEAFDLNANKNIGLIYLENILNHTAYIIKELKKKPMNEASVYNSVKHVIKVTFPDYIGLSEPFYKDAKCYKPDILIPSLNTAIEYKYATDEQKLIKTIEDILIDVVGYSNHPVYKLFYAVFYVTPGICTEQRFEILWKGYNFPNQWKAIFIIGE